MRQLSPEVLESRRLRDQQRREEELEAFKAISRMTDEERLERYNQYREMVHQPPVTMEESKCLQGSIVF